MTDFIKEWTMSISGTIVFGVICERLLPENTYKKYINIAIGLMLILSLLGTAANSNLDVNVYIPGSLSAYDLREEVSEKEDTETLRIYKEKLCERIKNDTQMIAGVDFDIKCRVSQEEEAFGEVEELYITVDAKNGVLINDKVIEIIEDNYGIDKDLISVKYVA